MYMYGFIFKIHLYMITDIKYILSFFLWFKKISVLLSLIQPVLVTDKEISILEKTWRYIIQDVNRLHIVSVNNDRLDALQNHLCLYNVFNGVGSLVPDGNTE